MSQCALPFQTEQNRFSSPTELKEEARLNPHFMQLIFLLMRWHGSTNGYQFLSMLDAQFPQRARCSFCGHCWTQDELQTDSTWQ